MDQEEFRDFVTVCIFRHFSRRFTIVDSRTQPRVGACLQKEFHGLKVALTHRHMQRREVVNTALIGISLERQKQSQYLKHIRASVRSSPWSATRQCCYQGWETVMFGRIRIGADL